MNRNSKSRGKRSRRRAVTANLRFPGRRIWRHPFMPFVLLVLCVAALLAPPEQSGPAPLPAPGEPITCRNPYIIDGDTLDCAGHRIRLSAIDAPEMPGHCRQGRECTPGDPHASRDRLHALTRGTVYCDPVDIDIYDRVVAQCRGAQGDVSCIMVAEGFAVNRYGVLSCGD